MMNTLCSKPLIATLLGAFALSGYARADMSTTAIAINRFGLDLHLRLAEEGGNRLASPWSIESALGMTYAGADGKTKEEMAKVLHFKKDEASLHADFAAIAENLEELTAKSRKQFEKLKADQQAFQQAAKAKATKDEGSPSLDFGEFKFGGPAGSNTPFKIIIANRLFGQDGYPFEKPFLTLMEKSYGAPLEIMDFIKDPEPSRRSINHWVEQQTKGRIKDLIPDGVIHEDSRLVLTNAIYMKAAWAEEFHDEPNAPFFINGTDEVKLPGLVKEGNFGYRKIPGGAMVSVPYTDGGLQFLLMIPDERNGLARFEKSLKPEILADATELPQQLVRLHFPQFKLEPGSIKLKDHLSAMGMPSAFDQPAGSADFSRMAPRKPDDYLFISDVIHKAFIAVDKYGTEAAAATTVMMGWGDDGKEPVKPLVVRVDRPFAFAVQHIQSGACLFLGRVTDPR